MDLKYMEYLIDINKTHSLAVSAEHLFITHQALSRIVKRIEQEYGIEIFAHLPQGLFLTEDGKKLLDFAQTILNAQDIFLQQVSHSKQSAALALQGELHIFAHESRYATFLNDCVIAFMRDNPHIHIHAMQQRSDQFLPLMTSPYYLENCNNNTIALVSFPRQKDGRVLFHDPSILDHYNFVPIAKNKIYALVNTSSPLARYSSISINTLKKQKIAALSNYEKYETTGGSNSAFPNNLYEMYSDNIVVRTNMLEILLASVVLGKAIGLIHSTLYQQVVLTSPYKDVIAAVPVTENSTNNPSWLGYLIPKQPSPVVLAFIKKLETFSQINSQSIK